MLIIVCKVTKLYIEVNGFVIRRLVCETETVNPFLLDNKVVLCAYLLPEVMNLFACWTVYLFNIQNISSPTVISFNSTQEIQKICHISQHNKGAMRLHVLWAMRLHTLCNSKSTKSIITIGYSTAHKRIVTR